MTDDVNWREKKAVSPLQSSKVEVEAPRHEGVKSRSQDDKAE